MNRTYRTEHPLYIIPPWYPALQEMFSENDMMEVSDTMANGDLHVYASKFSPETDVTDLVDPDYDDDGMRLSDFTPVYTPTPEEVVRALRGPKGDTGPMGMQGDRGESRKCECLEVEDEIANTPLPDPFMTKEKVYNLPPLPDETDLSTKDFVDLTYSLEDQADESSTTLYRALLTYQEGVWGMTHFTLPQPTTAEAYRDARVARSEGRHGWNTVYEYREPGGSWTRLIPNETSVPTEARSPEKRNVVFGYWGRKS